jgi:hypothetical protein
MNRTIITGVISLVLLSQVADMALPPEHVRPQHIHADPPPPAVVRVPPPAATGVPLQGWAI